MLEATWIAGFVLLGLCAVVAWRVLPVLLSRFDTGAMRVEPPLPIPTSASARDEAWNKAWARLHAWCFEGAGDGRSPFWQPWADPFVERRLNVLTLAFEPAEDRALLIERLSRHLDGSDRLAAAGGALAGWLLRLQVKRDDCLWWRVRRATDPWDCGYLPGSEEGLRALQRFQPRRATLMVADGLDEAACRDARQALEARSEQFRHPVRLLVVVAPSTGDVSAISEPGTGRAAGARATVTGFARPP